MMRNTKVTLYQWTGNNHPDEYFDIDWPAVHKECGVDHINWLNRQPHDKCQLSLEFFRGGKRLIVEFFNKETANRYYLMWAK